MSILDESWYTNEITIVKVGKDHTRDLGHSLSNGFQIISDFIKNRDNPLNERIETFTSLYLVPLVNKKEIITTLFRELVNDVNSSELLFMIFRPDTPQNIVLNLCNVVVEYVKGLLPKEVSVEEIENIKPNCLKLFLKCIGYLTQYSNYKTDKTLYFDFIEKIFETSSDYYIKSEACDMMYRLGSKSLQIKAESWFNNEMEHEDIDCKHYTFEQKYLYLISKNKQNVHLLDYEPVIEKIIDRCRNEKYQIKELNGVISYKYSKITDQDIIGNKGGEELRNWIREIQSNSANFFGFTTWDIVRMCYFLIQINEHKDELLKRFNEEIKESKDTCGSGYIVRLLNVFSGFDDDLTMSAKMKQESILKLRIYISSIITKLKPKEQEIVLKALEEKDKDTIDEFIVNYIFFDSDNLTNDEIQKEIYNWFGF